MSEKITEDGRKQLRELCDKATQGDWWIDSHGHRMVSRPRFDTVFEASSSMGPAVRHPETGNLSHWPNDWDATYIVAAQPKVVRGLLDELDQLKAENSELRAQAGESVGPLTLGIRGKAYDPPGTHRAYTYAEQPDNLGAWRLGEALVEAYRAPAGDHIDGGLGLLKSLQLRGFGVFEMDRAMTKEQP